MGLVRELVLDGLDRAEGVQFLFEERCGIV
jgi:hypothetical protein